MDNTREKLIELVREIRRKATAWHTAEDIADMLIANGVTVQEWIPVTERLPELDKLVVCYKKGKMFLGTYLGVNYSPVVGAFKSNEEYYSLGATHWMPLPQTPKEG